MALPDGFEWDATDRWGKDWLRCGRQIVASVSETAIRGTWIANVNRHGDVASCPYAYFRNRGAAMRSVERWAGAHADRLRHEVATGARKAPASAPLSREEKMLARKLRG
jgi:hypothetical protein